MRAEGACYWWDVCFCRGPIYTDLVMQFHCRCVLFKYNVIVDVERRIQLGTAWHRCIDCVSGAPCLHNGVASAGARCAPQMDRQNRLH